MDREGERKRDNMQEHFIWIEKEGWVKARPKR